ncbi:MAG TPA: hypothetical protein P5277_03655 [Candidatus Paceibacterota bacterium]|nr:hypothetical protein [Candidatus Paceibacterota bacterium]
MNTLREYALGLGLSAMFVSGCATTLDNGARTVVNGMLIPYKVLESTVTELNPIQGVKDGVLDTVEQLGYTLADKKTDRHPAERGEISTYIKERPALNAITNIATAAGLGAGIAEWMNANPVHVWQTTGYATGGQALIEGAHTVLTE